MYTHVTISILVLDVHVFNHIHSCVMQVKVKSMPPHTTIWKQFLLGISMVSGKFQFISIDDDYAC